jgi:hypothetical protein
VRRRIEVAVHAVRALGDDCTVCINEDRADRPVALFGGLSREIQRDAHEVVVIELQLSSPQSDAPRRAASSLMSR